MGSPESGVQPMPPLDLSQPLGTENMTPQEGIPGAFIAPAPASTRRGRDVLMKVLAEMPAEPLTPEEVFTETGNQAGTAMYKDMSPQAQSLMSQSLRLKAMLRTTRDNTYRTPRRKPTI